MIKLKDILNELTKDDIESNYAGPTAISYSINNAFRTFNVKTNTITFKTWDALGSRLQHTVKIQMVEFNDIKNESDRIEDTVKLALHDGDLKVHCTCKSFQYNGFAYISNVLDTGIKNEPRRPVIRNPREQGIVCKHIKGLLEKIDRYIPTISRQIEREMQKSNRMAPTAQSNTDKVKPGMGSKKLKAGMTPSQYKDKYTTSDSVITDKDIIDD